MKLTSYNIFSLFLFKKGFYGWNLNFVHPYPPIIRPYSSITSFIPEIIPDILPNQFEKMKVNDYNVSINLEESIAVIERNEKHNLLQNYLKTSPIITNLNDETNYISKINYNSIRQLYEDWFNI